MADVQTKLAVTGVCLNPTIYRAVSQCISGIPGGAVLGNSDRYQGADRDIARILDQAQTRICVIDFDQNFEEALAPPERLDRKSTLLNSGHTNNSYAVVCLK